MSQADIELVERVRDIYKSLTKVPCTGCAYCLPCPAGVNIPQCFTHYNNKYLFGHLDSMIMYHTQLGDVMSDKAAKASLCINCGKCEKHCPQHIEIRKELKNVTSELDGLLAKPLAWMIKRVLKA